MLKAQIYQHSILPQILWPLLVYTVPITTVEAMERKISSYLAQSPTQSEQLCPVWHQQNPAAPNHALAGVHGAQNMESMPCSTGNPEIKRWYGLVSRCEQAGNGRQKKLWRWLSQG